MSNSVRRAAITISVVWIISFMVALPIMLGVNTMHLSTVCEFTNAFYIITSSSVSFYIPGLVMLILYSIVMYRLHKRQLMAKARKQQHRIKKLSTDGLTVAAPGNVVGLKGLMTAHSSALFSSAKLMSEIGRRLDAVASESTVDEDETLDSLTSSEDEECEMPFGPLRELPTNR